MPADALVDTTADNDSIYDAVIIGGGPAGISCALELHESRLKYIMLDGHQRIGGQLPWIENTIRNFAAQYWDNGKALQADLESLCKRIGIRARLGEPVVEVDLARKQVRTDNAVFAGRNMFLATGTSRRELNAVGIADIHDSIIWDVEKNESTLVGKRVAVIGGGDNALMDTAWLAQRCSVVHVVHRSSQFRARPDVIAEARKYENVFWSIDSGIKSVVGSAGQVATLTLVNNVSGVTTDLTVDYLVIKIGSKPNSDLFGNQLSVDGRGFVLVNEYCQTSADGVFAGGDLVAPDCPAIARSVGHGLVAARAICTRVWAG